MKDLLKSFGYSKALKQLSDGCIDDLLSHVGGDKEAVAALRGSAKNKTQVLEGLIELITAAPEIEPQTYRLLRTAYFFHQHRKALPDLLLYVRAAGGEINEEMLKACKSEAEQVIRLAMAYENHVQEYFLISLHTQQSPSYWQRRSEYFTAGTSFDAVAVEKLQSALIKELRPEGRGHTCEMKEFIHDGKRFLFMSFQDSPTERGEWVKDKVVQHFARPVMEVAFVIDERLGAIDVFADNAQTRSILHCTCAAVFFNKDIEARPKDNEVYDLAALLDIVAKGQPISVTHPENYVVQQVLVEKLRLRRRGFPSWEITIDLKLSKDAPLEQDHGTSMCKLFQSLIYTDDTYKGGWRLTNITANHAQLVAIYFDATEGKQVCKRFTIDNKGGSNLHHHQEHEDIKKYLRAADILHEKATEELPLRGAPQNA